ncbi:MAG: hypothetical protein KGI37_03095 [Alphaproteobacteria bacterium]|nr:hypothetical protein [Alphaproteobacteria bacterium]
MLAACGGDTARVFYAYTPPLTPGGMMCVDQCRKSHDFCAQSCGLDYRACINDMQAMSTKAFDRYAQQRFNAQLPVDRDPSSFEQDGTCNANRNACLADCESPYNSCYKSCGGSVDSLTAPSACSFPCF